MVSACVCMYVCNEMFPERVKRVCIELRRMDPGSLVLSLGPQSAIGFVVRILGTEAYLSVPPQ